MKKFLFLLLLFGIGVTSIGWSKAESGSCARPWPSQVEACRQLEQEILGETVRILFHGYVEIDEGYNVRRVNGTLSHATIFAGRYLVTHNHFGIRLSQALLFDQYGSGSFSGVSIYKLDGQPLLDNAPLTSFTVVFEEGETVLLDFGPGNGSGFFAEAGLASAEIATGESMTLTPGREVAQVDWDPAGNSRVVWTKIDDLVSEKKVPLARVDHFIELGASGGGLFLDGLHIGNNWSRTTETSVRTGAQTGQFSLVALNTSEIVKYINQ